MSREQFVDLVERILAGRWGDRLGSIFADSVVHPHASELISIPTTTSTMSRITVSLESSLLRQ
jgi:hypothetical protein